MQKTYSLDKSKLLPAVCLNMIIPVAVAIIIWAVFDILWEDPVAIRLAVILFLASYFFYIMDAQIFRNYKTVVNQDYIEFHSMYFMGRPDRIMWKDIDRIRTGNLEVAHGRYAVRVESIEVCYTESSEAGKMKKERISPVKNIKDAGSW